MLARVLEPEVMDSQEEARDYDSMDHTQVNRVFVTDFLVVWDGRNPILDVGTGTAQIPIELCRQSASASIVAIDLAEEMLVVGRDNVSDAGLEERIRLERVDAKGIPYSDGAFAAVISNSIVHHIPEPRRVVAEMVRVLVSGGILFVRDLLRPADLSTLNNLVELHAAGANGHQKRMFAESLNAALTLDEVRSLVLPFGFGPLSVRQTTDRHWTWTARKM
jgi:ubiquinone/menaquinone biosynthesis C-methylase UbiE